MRVVEVSGMCWQILSNRERRGFVFIVGFLTIFLDSALFTYLFVNVQIQGSCVLVVLEVDIFSYHYLLCCRKPCVMYTRIIDAIIVITITTILGVQRFLVDISFVGKYDMQSCSSDNINHPAVVVVFLLYRRCKDVEFYVYFSLRVCVWYILRGWIHIFF